ncbi:MAG TPA: DNA replication/repair protein RecF [Steroidobacteraceae bacterium]|nr:DNA replication/repair protein RecF [Steroidobacteraceae bacterium]
MTVRRVQVTDFRCLHQADLDLDPQFTLISGPNASGKTSLLEAIYVLGRGRSFRTRRIDHLVRAGAQRLIVFGEVEKAHRSVGLGIEGSASGFRAKIGGERVSSLAELAAALPVQIIDPEIHRLIEEGPSRRRRFLDWGVFHVEPGFVATWQKYTLVLRQRNAVLKAAQSSSMVSAWDGELIRHGELLTEARMRYVERLAPVADSLASKLLGMKLALTYRSGWARDLSLREALDRSRRQDQELGATQVGPQRADLSIRLDGLPARDRISRGQQKLLAAVLLLAQINLFPEECAVRPMLLLDDPAAELDLGRLAALIREVRAQSLQLVVTTLHEELDELSAFGTPGRRYRLDAGSIREE